jgi:hypothetical protein
MPHPKKFKELEKWKSSAEENQLLFKKAKKPGKKATTIFLKPPFKKINQNLNRNTTGTFLIR